MLKMKDIVHENGGYWVLRDKENYHVMKIRPTHSVSDSCYASEDLAKARCDYLANRLNKS